jgi:hypothetical protein
VPEATTSSHLYTHRPLPIAALNVTGRAAKRLGMTPLRLDEESMIAAARKSTGLHDFGDESFREPLRVLIDSIEREANLTLLGRIITRGRLTGVLTNRLRIEALLRKHPEIRERKIERPIVIAGLQRTGTTMLHRLIAADPRLRSLASWEALSPAPVARSAWEKQDPRFKLAKTAERGLAYIAPAFFAIHPVEADAPEEEVILLDYSFMSTVAEASFHVPTYASWLEQQDQTPAYRYLKTLLQVLDWQRPGKRWVR